MAARIETLASYVPPIVTRRFTADPTALTAPASEQFPGAVLFADIAGFTPLAEQLAERGRAGAEEISRELNAYFGRVIDLVTSAGGEVVKFAGDALLALWPVPGSEEDLATRTRRAVQCGLLLQHTLGDYSIQSGPRLSLRIGITAGRVLAAHVGGVGGRWEFLLAGQPLKQVGAAQHRAREGDTVLTANAWALVQAYCTGDPLAEGFVRLKDAQIPIEARSLRLFQPPVTAETALRAYIPAGALARLDAGQTEWLAELRRVTVIFLNMNSLDHWSPGALDELHAAMQALQAPLSRLEGTIRQMIVDDKGTVLVAAFGLPPRTHEDDAARSVKAAMVMQSELRKLHIASSVGLATGHAFCGPVGSSLRREYAMVGDVVNLAARLMEAASGDILCDETTSQAASPVLPFKKLPAFLLKGRRSALPVYRPLERPATRLAERPMFGRDAERAVLADALAALMAGTGGVVVIEGEPGIGKSRLVTAMLEDARARGIRALVGEGEAVEKSTLYHAWRGIFRALVNADTASNVGLVHQRVLSLLDDPELTRLVPLLNVVLPTEFPDNDLTSQLIGQLRADNMNKLLVALLKRASGAASLVVVIEDAHWLDSASWNLAALISQQVNRALLVIVTRPFAEPPAEYEQLVRSARGRHLKLGMLSAPDTLALVRESLGWPRIDAAVGELIHEQAEGNPFFVEELCYSLRDTGRIIIADLICQIIPGLNIATLHLPDTVQGVIISRMDQLTPTEQLILKVASVIGRIFPFHVLKDVYPIPEDKTHLSENIERLARLDLTPLFADGSNPTYFFKHVIIQDVAYELMITEQRRQLHRAVAEWFERARPDDLTSVYPLLAHHWTRAGVTAKAIEYLEKAGEQAFRSGAYQEALRFFGEALDLDAKPGPDAQTRLRRARWERQLAESYLGLGDHMHGREHLRRTCELVGSPEPAANTSLIASVLRQLALQMFHRLWPPAFLARSELSRAQALEAARAYIRLVEVYWFRQETLSLVHAGIRALNLAEQVGPSPELARAYAIMCISAGSIPIHAFAEGYGIRALRTAEVANNIPATAYALFITSVYRIGVAKWQAIQDALTRSETLFRELGDLRLLGDARTVLAMSALYQGDFARSAAQFAAVHTQGVQIENFQHQVWGLIGLAESEFRLGRPEDAARRLESAIAVLQHHPDRAEELRAQGLLATVYLRRGERALAEDAASRAALLISQLAAPTSHYLLEGYAGPTEVFTIQWEEMVQVSVPNSHALARRARLSAANLRRYARVFPIGTPRAWLWTGSVERLSARSEKARKAWYRSLRSSEKLGMPYEYALVHYEIGRHLSTDDPRRTAYLSRAQDLFTRLGAMDDRERARRLLDHRNDMESRQNQQTPPQEDRSSMADTSNKNEVTQNG